MRFSTDVVPITTLKNHAADLVRYVAESGRTVFVTQHGVVRVAVMGVEVFDRWREALAILRLVAHAEADAEAGRTLSEKEALSDAAEPGPEEP
jgi:prevent-host-death family protein